MTKRTLAGILLAVAFVTITVFVWLNVGAVAAASEPIPDCIPFAKAGNEVLYFCESNFGPDCVWDPSEALGAGVMDCEW